MTINLIDQTGKIRTDFMRALGFTPEPSPRTIQMGPPKRMKLTIRFPTIKGMRLRWGSPLVILKPLWFEKGWRQLGQNEYRGAYAAAGRTWKGIVQQPYPQKYDTYIWSPPLTELERNTSHRLCFQPNGTDGRYKVHFSVEPSSLDHAIASVETVLAEALIGRA